MSRYICEECAHLKWELQKQQVKNAGLLGEIDGLKAALVARKTMEAGDLLAEGIEYRVIKVKKMKHTSGFTVVEDENA